MGMRLFAGKKTTEIKDLEQLDKLIEKAHKNPRDNIPELISLDSGEYSLSIGVGKKDSVATFQSDDPPYFVSKGAKRDGSIVFFFDGHESEFDINAAIPLSDAKQAAREFFKTGKRPENISWQEA